MDEEKKKNREKQNANLLTPQEINSRLTPEQMKEKMSMMGKKSAEKKRANRMMIDIARKILEMPVSEQYTNVKSIMTRYGIPQEEMNYATAIMTNMIVKAMTGDANAAKFVRDSAGMDALTVLKEEQFEYMKENGTNINVSLDGEVTTKSRVQIYLPERDDDPE